MVNRSRADMDELRALHGGCCEECGSTRHLEFAHKEATTVTGMSRGINARYLDIKKHPERYRLLCQHCHRRYDGETWRSRTKRKFDSDEVPF